MSDETTDTTDTEEQDSPDTAPDTEEQDTWTPPDRDSWTKLQDKAKRREDKLREAQAELAKLRGEKDKPSEPSETDKLRTGVVRTAGRAVLAGMLITDKKDQATILSTIDLSGVEVDSDGEVDTDALEERLNELRRILGGADAKTPRPRLDARDKGGSSSKPADPDSARYRGFLTGQR